MRQNHCVTNEQDPRYRATESRGVIFFGQLVVDSLELRMEIIALNRGPYDNGSID
jgi:hypothetical protein